MCHWVSISQMCHWVSINASEVEDCEAEHILPEYARVVCLLKLLGYGPLFTSFFVLHRPGEALKVNVSPKGLNR